MIPTELQSIPQWVMWRIELDAAGKPTKVPYSAFTGQKASSTDKATWCDYATAIAALATNAYAGVGFVLSDNDPYTLLDLDDPQGDPIVAERHMKLIQMMQSYTEWSPSGKGMHIIVKGKLPSGSHREHLGAFSTHRYMTMTGNTYLDLPIVDRHELLQHLYADINKPRMLTVVKDSPIKHSEYEIYERMMRGANGDKVLRTWNGDWEGLYPTHSECDQALINYIQFYTQNVAQIERMFLSSPCAYRLVSGLKHKWPKYISTMIQKSFDRQLPELDISALTTHALMQQKPTELEVIPAEAAITADSITWPGGAVGAIARFIYDASPQQIPEVALAGALTLMAGICGRAYNVSDTGLNIYILILAGTGIGKEAAASGIGKLVAKIAQLTPAINKFRGPAEIASGPALTKALKENLCCYSILGEFGLRLHEMCNERAQPIEVGKRRVLLDLFHKSGHGNQVMPHVYSDKDKNTGILEAPAYTILGEGTPHTFYRYLDESMITDGLMPRFIIIEYAGDRPYWNENAASVDPDPELVNWMAYFVSHCIELQVRNKTLPVTFTPEAHTMSREYSREVTRRINASGDHEIARQLLNRAHLKMMKIAAILAVGIDPNEPIITLDLLQWAQRLIERDMSNILSKFSSGAVGAENGEMNQQQDMKRIIRDYIYKEPGAWMTSHRIDAKMKNANIISYQYLQRIAVNRAAFRKDRIGSTNAIQRTLQTLTNMGLILEVRQSTMQQEFNTTAKAYAVLDLNAL